MSFRYFDLNQDDVKLLVEYGVEEEWLKQFELQVKNKLFNKFYDLVKSGFVSYAVSQGISHFLQGEDLKKYIEGAIKNWIKEYGT